MALWKKYDALNRIRFVTTPDTAAVETQYSGSTTTTIDQAGKKRTTTMDALGRLTAVVEDPGSLKHKTVYAYDALDNLICVNQGTLGTGDACETGLAHSRSFAYDSFKRLLTANNPESGTIRYSYDDAGNLLSRKDALNKTTCYGTFTTSCDGAGYDELNRVTKKSYSDGTPAVTYAYDTAGVANAAGRLTQVSNSVSTAKILSYDALGRVLGSSQTTQGAPQPYTFSYAYNLAGDLTSETLPSGRTIATGYDQANRPVWVKGVKAGIASNYVGNAGGTDGNDPNVWVQYAPHGAVFQFGRGNGLRHGEEYNSRLQETGSFEALNGSAAAGSLLFSSCPFWGVGSAQTIYPGVCPLRTAAADNGNLIAYDEIISSRGPGAGFASYSQYPITYDALNRLTGITDTGGWARSFAYDQWGNMAVTAATPGGLNVNTPQGTDLTAIYDAKNRRTDGFSYDAAGNLLTVKPYGSVLSYDAENRLAGAATPGAYSYFYDGDGRRVKKSGAGGTTIYVYDAAGRLAAEYGDGAAGAPPCGTCYLSYDYLGSVRMVTDGGGFIVSRHDYYPFGEEVAAGQAGRNAAFGFGGADAVRERFTGKERDAESGLDYFGARYYGSALGRFTSPDWSAAPEPVPYADLADPQTLNLYGYVRNNPLAHSDADGHCCDAVWDSIEEIGREAEAGAFGPVGEVVGPALVGGALLGAGLANVDWSKVEVRGTLNGQYGDFSSQYKSEAKPGTLGKPDHQQTVKEEAEKLKGGRTEVTIPTPGGKKDSRRADATGVDPNTGKPKIVQVFRPQGKKGTTPKREVDAASDIERATGIKPTMVPVRPVKPKPCLGCEGPSPNPQQ